MDVDDLKTNVQYFTRKTIKMEVFNPLTVTDEVKRKYRQFILDNNFPNNPLNQEKVKELLQEDGCISNGPFISLSHRYKEHNITFKDFLQEKFDNPEIADILHEIKHLYIHQINGIEKVKDGQNTIVSTGTGSGKTMVFILPIIDYALKFKKENNNPHGVKAFISYPMNALAYDQLDVIKKISFWLKELYDKDLTYGIYIGDTPRNDKDTRKLDKLETSCPFSKSDIKFLEQKEYHKCINCIKNSQQEPFKPDEVEGKKRFTCPHQTGIFLHNYIITRKEMQDRGPDFFITNYSMMELLLLRDYEQPLFSSGATKYVVLDESHTYTGAKGVHVALQNRRVIKRLENKGNKDIVCITTSATLTKTGDREEDNKIISKFATKLFGKKFDSKNVVTGEIDSIWHLKPDTTISKEPNIIPELFTKDNNIKLISELSDDELKAISENISNPQVFKEAKSKYEEKENILYYCLRQNKFFWNILKEIEDVKTIDELIDLVDSDINFHEKRELIWQYLYLGSEAKIPGSDNPLVSIQAHLFIRPPRKFKICTECQEADWRDIHECQNKGCGKPMKVLGVCHGCGQIFYGDDFYTNEIVDSIDISSSKNAEALEILGKNAEHEDKGAENTFWWTYNEDEPNHYFCIDCDLYSKIPTCEKCGSNCRGIKIEIKKGKPNVDPCPFCDNHDIQPPTKVTSMAMSFNVSSRQFWDIQFNTLPEKRKLLLFSDSVQEVSMFASAISFQHKKSLISQLALSIIEKNNGQIPYPELFKQLSSQITEFYDDSKSNTSFEADITKGIGEFLKLNKKRITPENLGILEIDYIGLTKEDVSSYFSEKNPIYSDKNIYPLIRQFLDEFRHKNVFLRDENRNTPTALAMPKTWREKSRIKYCFYRGSTSEAKTYWKSKEGIDEYDIDKVYSKRIASLDTNWPSKLLTKAKPVIGLDEIEDDEIYKDILDYIISRGFLKQHNVSNDVCLPSEKTLVFDLEKIELKKPTDIYICEKCNTIKYYDTYGKCIGFDNDQKHKDIPNLVPIEYSKVKSYYTDLYKSQPLKMIAREDTASSEDRRNTETEFKKGKINLVVASPTLELGVDIGDLNTVGLIKTPPSPASYIQRVGRAGRKTKISLSTTFIKDTCIIDNFYFDHPQELIKGKVSELDIFLENSLLIKYHIFSLILENISAEKLLKPNFQEYVTQQEGYQLLKNFIEKNYDSLVDDVCETFREELIDSDKNPLIQIPKIKEITQTFLLEFVRIRDKYKAEYQNIYNRYKLLRDERNQLEDSFDIFSNNSSNEEVNTDKLNDEINSTKDLLKDLSEANTIRYLSDNNFIPRYAFPTETVSLIQIPSDHKNWIWSRRYKFFDKQKNIGLFQFSPGMEIFYSKDVYRSIGVDMSEAYKPKKTKFLLCSNCLRYYVYEGHEEKKCSCGEILTLNENGHVGLNPNRFVVQWESKIEDRIGRDSYVEAGIFIKGLEEIEYNESYPGFKVSHPSQTHVLSLVNNCFKNGNAINFQICEECGKRLDTEELKSRDHFNISEKSFGKGAVENERCSGKPIEVPGKDINVKFYHEIGTRAIRIQVRDEIKNSDTYLEDENSYLNSLLNAFINAGQIIARADDGEIGGEFSPEDGSIILFDNIDGGVGYVDLIYKNFDRVLDQIKKFVFDCSCDRGCPSCIYSSRRKFDAKLVDKRVLEGFFKEDITLTDNQVEEEADKGIVQRIMSPHNSTEGFDIVKKAIEEAKKEVNIVSMYITDDKFQWTDGSNMSWMDILIGKKRTSEVKIRAILRPPSVQKYSQKRREEIRQLTEAGIDVRIFEDKFQGYNGKSIAHHKEVIVDPSLPNRHVSFISANLSAETIKNRDRVLIADDDFASRHTSVFEELWSISRHLLPEDRPTDTSYDFTRLETNEQREKAMAKVGSFLRNAKEEVLISDPYITEMSSWEYLLKWIPEGVNVKILSSSLESKHVEKIAEKFREDNKSFEVLRYYNNNKEIFGGMKSVIHERYILIDGKVLVTLALGLNSFNSQKLDNHIIIYQNIDLAKDWKNQFYSFWNQKNNPNPLIKDFPSRRYSS
ncbi:MAG: DEAD/DEAH box helicase [Candidatus Lokiarchaeota archaeon]|nr:DEAD/DEAH box helicase [Candidatus Lokiarchaeota archaeon]